MLKHLHVENFAIIDFIELDFYSGMTVLTGETGAGKSILIDAISLLLGDRASQDMIRSGSDKAIIEGVFLSDNEDLQTYLRLENIDFENNTLTIHREITVQNKNLIRMNGSIVSLQQLKGAAKYLADIHSQFDTQRLINPQNYLELIDGFHSELIQSYLQTYQSSVQRFHQAYQDLEKLRSRKKALEEKREIYEYQYAELASSHLSVDELDTIQSEVQVLENYDKVFEKLNTIKTQIESGQVLENLYQAADTFASLQTYSPEFQSMHEQATNHYYELEDLFRTMNSMLQSMNFDPIYLEKLQSRLYELEKLTEKYKKNIAELCQYRDELQGLLNESADFAFEIENKMIEVEKAFNQTSLDAKQLTQARRSVSEKITKEILAVLKDLGLANTEFEIRFQSDLPPSVKEKEWFRDTGVDQIDFYLSTNLGEPLKPLSKTASGGEMSRVMLAFKTIFIRSQKLSTMIFDEIDTGISGKIAKQIAKKIKEISATCQVLSITHIPQVVATGNHHLKVEKKMHQSRTTAATKYLDFDERVKEIAMMISDDLPSESTIQSAKELLLEN